MQASPAGQRMSRRGNCHDNAVAESFFNLLKRERIRRRTYKTRAEARQDVFDFIEMFYGPQTRQERDAVARRLRTAAENEHRGCLGNSGLFRQLEHRNHSHNLNLCSSIAVIPSGVMGHGSFFVSIINAELTQSAIKHLIAEGQGGV